MPIALPVGAILEVRLRGFIHGQETVNVFHYAAAQAVSDAVGELDLLKTAANSALVQKLRLYTTTEMAGMRTDLQWVYPTRTVANLGSTPGQVGNLAGASVTSGATLVVRRTTQLAGRKYRGRIYLPGLPASYFTISQLNNTVPAAFYDDLTGMVTGSLTAANGNVYNPVIWSWKNKTVSTPIVAGAVDPVIRYQRRREIGKGV